MYIVGSCDLNVTCRLQEKEKISIMLEDEKKQATEQAKMLEMDLEVCQYSGEDEMWLILLSSSRQS